MTMNGNQGFGGGNPGHEPTKEELEAQAAAGEKAEAPVAPTQPSQPEAPAQPSAPAETQPAPADQQPAQETAPATEEIEVTQDHLDQFPELIERGIELGQRVLTSVLDEVKKLKEELSGPQQG